MPEERSGPAPVRPLKTREEVLAAADAATAALPAWPPLGHATGALPFVPRADESFVDAGLRLARVHGARLTLPRSHYAAALAAGAFGEPEIVLALERLASDLPADLSSARVLTRMAAPETDPASFRVPTVLDLVGPVARLDWRRLVLDRLTRFCADRFDQGAAPWGATASGGDAWQAFREELCVDRSLELHGLRDCRARFAALPEDGDELLLQVAIEIGVPHGGLAVWCERLLADLAGWHGLDRTLHDAPGAAARNLLPLRAAFELLLHERFGSGSAGLALGWDAARLRLIEDDGDRWRLHRAVDHVLHVAAEIGAEQRLSARLTIAPQPSADAGRPAFQVVCSTDVREERLRRALEGESEAVETFGTIGDFGLPAEFTEPAPAPSGLASSFLDALAAMRGGGVSAFAHVEALGLLFALRLLRDALALRSARVGASRYAAFDGLPLELRVDAAEALVRECGLQARFAPLVMLMGHGASSVGDPQAAFLQSDACGGHPSDTAAANGVALLNDPEVRRGLAERGIEVPDDTVFVAALHDTTRDAIRVLGREAVPTDRVAVLGELEDALARAVRRVRSERAAALGLGARVAGRRLARRSRDYSVVRPEQGQAGCSAFVAAPRALTRGVDLGTGCQLHSYDETLDPDGTVLARVLGRSLLLAARTTLQYHLAAVDPEHFGAGDRTLVDVVGGVGVLEGNDGALRTGLPLQLVHDGTGLAHAPRRLDARIMASTTAIDAVLERESPLRLLVQGGWITLRTLKRSGEAGHLYDPRSGWQALAAETGGSTENVA